MPAPVTPVTRTPLTLRRDREGIPRICVKTHTLSPADGLPELNFSFGQNVLYVRNPAREELQLDIFDVTGRRVLSRTIQESQASIDVSEFPRGVYFVSVRVRESKPLLRKVIIR